MTTTRMQRCDHCKDVYPYHPSVYGMMPTYNDNRYCPSCMEVLEKALKAVPVKYKKKFVPSTDYTREQIVETQNIRCNGPLAVRRIMPGLFDLKDTGNHYEDVCEMMPDPITGRMVYYHVTWWSKTPEKMEISKEVWWDVKNKVPARNQEDYRS